MVPGRSDGQSSFSAFLALDINIVGDAFIDVAVQLRHVDLDWLKIVRLNKIAHCFAEAFHAEHRNSSACGGFVGIGLRHEHAAHCLLPGMHGHWQSALRRANRAVKAKFADHHGLGQALRMEDALPCQDSQRYRQIEG